ncbi:VacJ family lipoprotein [Caldimonas brevitalea]|uniref:ABC transporter n=1 Tax=Caldimonas brevitalea TaxID=413882 RepID=A0A0G3BM75_9BURK|nr:VacJ family lipoprotein [Caldimonas brevitalea]AKJ27660.1 ABC transporter [Caldimonas brevitalea]
MRRREQRPSRALPWLCTVVLAATLAGCAQNPKDPLEPLNRKVYAFNEAVDKAVLKPVATVYRDTLPQPVRTGVTNFFSNLGDAWSAVNGFLQLKLETGLMNTMRFGVNTFFGLGGLLDIATEAGIEAQDEDFGQTLGRWGIGAGPYLVLPLLGPSTLRDTAALPVDMQAAGYVFRNDATTAYSLAGLRIVNTRANLLGATSMLEDAALDRYLFLRDAYLQRRQSLVYDGDPPEAEEAEEDADTPAEASDAGAAAADAKTPVPASPQVPASAPER